MNTWDVIVVGGGLAGLAAGATARAAGASTLVVERAAPGGRVRTVERQGFTFNMGAHAFYLGGEGLHVLKDLGIRPTGSPPPLSHYQLRAGGELHVLPTGPGSLSRTTALGLRSKAKLGALLARLPRMDAAELAGVSVEEWIAEHSLRPDAEDVIRALVRLSTYSAALADMSAGAAVMQLQRGAAEGVLYLDGGWAQLVEKLAALVEIRKANVRGLADAGPAGVVVETDDGDLRARAVVLAAGTPAAAAGLLPDGDPGWADVGLPVTAACLDVGTRTVPSPGYVLGADEPIYGTTQSPPAAEQAPAGGAMVAVVRYGARDAATDRAALEGWLRHVGVAERDVVVDRFLAHITVVGGQPRAENGGLTGRPRIDETGTPRVFVAGDWVGPEGLLSDAALASARAAAIAAVSQTRPTVAPVG